MFIQTTTTRVLRSSTHTNMLAQRNSPKTAVKQPAGKSTTLQFLFDLDSKYCANQNNGNKKIHSSDSRDEELSSIIVYCTESRLDDQESVLKRLKLTQLLSIIKTSVTPISDQTLDLLFKMVAANLFRPLPPPSSAMCSMVSCEEADDVIAVPSAAWAYLQIVYDILLRLIIKINVKSVQGSSIEEQQFITRSFILNLLNLFNSDDPRERDAVKNTVHRIYSKFTSHRSFIRKSLTHILLHFTYDATIDHRPNGIAEILEIWGSIINGFTLPLKHQHKVFLSKVLIPLHKPKTMHLYHRQLAYCVSQFVQKEAELGGVVVGKILRWWPVTNCQKEVLLIGELEEIVENIGRREYLTVALRLWSRFTKCIKSDNSQVAERALDVWNNKRFMRVVSQDIEMVFPILVEAVEMNLKLHWNQNVQDLTENVKMLLQELHPLLYKTCLDRLEENTFGSIL